jgi:16S rRNA (guanine527-N7)-methyltransferase
MENLSDNVISVELKRYGIVATVDICSAIRAFIPRLLYWNSKMSLTAVTDPLEVLRFHFGESMFAASVLANKNGRLADVGSGAGFPGIPLKLIVPTLDVVLIESNAKKAAFLADVVRELALPRVEVFHGRFDGLDAGALGLDFITARALGMHDRLVQWSRGVINPGGSLILWLGEDDASKVSTDRSWQWRKSLSIPQSHRRVLLVGDAS